MAPMLKLSYSVWFPFLLNKNKKLKKKYVYFYAAITINKFWQITNNWEIKYRLQKKRKK